jgi:hypothetical protein
MTQAFEHSRVMLFRFAVQPSIQTMTVGKGWRRGMHQTFSSLESNQHCADEVII